MRRVVIGTKTMEPHQITVFHEKKLFSISLSMDTVYKYDEKKARRRE